MLILLAAFALGIMAGLRAMTPLAVLSWGAAMGAPPLAGTSLAFLGFTYTPWILTALALAELVTDQLPNTPSRKVPVQFGTRLLVGAVCGAAVALPGQTGWTVLVWAGVAAGLAGALAGTLGGSSARARLASRFNRDRPAALIEDAVAILGAILIVGALR